MKKVISVVLSLLFFSLFCQNLFAEISLLSPVKGTWANKQILVIEDTKAGDYFYSINGSDPERFGFAYDGPVLLDMTGPITLKVTYVAHNGKKESVAVDYTVIENDGYAAPYSVFISSFYDTGIINYSSGSVITVPETLEYSLGLPPDSFMKGQDLFLSEKSVLTRSIPCVIWDKASDVKWRFVIKTFPQTPGIYSRRDVPFTITDWDTIAFTDNNLLYKIDSDFWELPKKPKTIDRTKSHMISWQNLEFQPGNPVEFFVLPPKPELLSRQEPDGGITYYFEGDDSYAMAVLSEDDNQYQELFTELGVDAFAGDKVSGIFKIGVFTNSVYQGEVEASYKIDKRPPVNPIITSNVDGFYSRENITAHIQGVSDTDLYVAVSEPLLLDYDVAIDDPNAPIFQQVSADNFKLCTGSQDEVVLAANKDGPVYYKVRAYSQSGENASQISEYSVLIDQYNYYYDSESDSEIADGTMQHPYKDFAKCLEAINKSSAVCLNVLGNIVVPEGKNTLSANCTIVNKANGTFVFEGDSSLVVKNASLELSNFRFLSKKGKSSSIIPLIKLENAVLTLDNCEAGIEFGKNGTFIDSYKSVINITDSIISVSAVAYTSFISAVKSRISIKYSTLNAVADTCVLISANQGELNIANNSMKVSGKAGRISELFGAEALFENNTFNAQLAKKGKMTAIYADKDSNLAENKNNNYGF